MKKQLIIATIILAAFCSKANAQYYTTMRYDPFVNGNKYIGISVGMGGWFSPADFILNVNSYDTQNPYLNFQANELSRSLFNPSVMIHYKRVLEGRTLSWGNSYYIGYFSWSGKVKGVSKTNPNVTFTTNYHTRNVDLTDLYYAIYHINDNLSVNAGIGMTIGLNLDPKATITFSDGSDDVETTGGLEFMDLLKCNIDFVVGAEYKLSDSFHLNCNFIGYPIDFFGMANNENGDTKGLRGVGQGLYITKKFPFSLTFGFTYAL